jgi:hypothetical protein
VANEQVFCGAKKCSNLCPAYRSSDFSGVICKIVKAKIEGEKAKVEAYKKMTEYYSLKITNHE